MKLFGYDMILFRFYLILFGSIFKLQQLSVMLVAALTNFGVKNQGLQVFFKFAAGDLVLVSSYEVSDIVFCESLLNSEAISDYGSQSFALHSPKASLPTFLSHPHLLTKLVKLETFYICLDTCS